MAIKMTTCFVAIVVTVLFTGARAQSSCTNVLISMSPCLNYLTGNSSTPSSTCCSQLQTVVRSEPQCLCAALNSGASSLGGLNINQTRALALPRACNVQTPPVSQCNTASPTEAPTGASDSPNTSVPGNGSKTVPTTNSNSSDGSSTALSFSLFFLLFIASYAST